MNMNKKEKRLIEMFKEGVEISLQHCCGSIWGFLGSLEASLAFEAQSGSDGAEKIERAEKLMVELKKITDRLRMNDRVH